MKDEAELRQNLETGNRDRYLRLQAAVMARELGFDPKEYSKPFPGNEFHVTHNYPPDPAPAKPPLSRFLGPLVAAGITAGGMAIGMPFLAGLLSKTTEKIIHQPGKTYDVNVDMEVIPPRKN